MATHSGQLPIPDGAKNDPRAVELVRAWAAYGQQEIVLASEAWDDPAAWGILLVDIARNVAEAYASRHQCDFDLALQRIKDGFEAEWNQPTE